MLKTSHFLNSNINKSLTHVPNGRFFPDTLLGSSEIEKYYNEEVKAYYFDRHRGMFAALLYFYQSRGVFRSPTNIDRDIVEEELEFFKVCCRW